MLVYVVFSIQHVGFWHVDFGSMLPSEIMSCLHKAAHNKEARAMCSTIIGSETLPD